MIIEKMDLLISVIIPVYNVEKYLRQCLDSVINQTYRNLEIIVVDDGSTDSSGIICDEYAESDSRIIVYHTENHGLSAARNYALDKMNGEYVAFLDSDDWLQLDAYQVTLETAISMKTDIVSFQHFRDFKNSSFVIQNSKATVLVEGEEILNKHILEQKITNVVWDKLYKAHLFKDIRYPEGRYEDIATTYLLLLKSDRVACIPNCLIHYRIRENSISRDHTLQGLIEYWEAHKTKYNLLSTISEEYQHVLAVNCMLAISRMWRWYSGSSKHERRKAKKILFEMQRFAKEQYNVIWYDHYFSRHVKLTCLFARSRNPVLLWFLFFVNQIYRAFNNDTCFEE